MATDISKMQPYSGPVSSQFFPHLTILLLGLGFACAAWFFIAVAASAKREKSSLLKELLGAAIASAFLGCGTVFLMLWVGIYI